MPGLMIIAHAPLASALKAVAGHALPERAALVAALDVTPDMSLDDVEVIARGLLEQVRSPDALILTDVYGATPCNAAQRLADGVRVRVVAGVNVPMLWRTLDYADEPLEAVALRAIVGGEQGVRQVATTKPQNQALKAGANDQVKHQHQQ